eukprot:3228799-Pleurochrysis_carterae.AAC.1
MAISGVDIALARLLHTCSGESPAHVGEGPPQRAWSPWPRRCCRAARRSSARARGACEEAQKTETHARPTRNVH